VSPSESWKERSWACGGIPVMVSSLDLSAVVSGFVGKESTGNSPIWI